MASDATPIHRVHVDGFWMDKTVVTNEQFANFAAASRYVTIAERTWPQQTPPALPPNLVAGSLVFTPPAQEVTLNDPGLWWHYVPGANWRHPLGPQSKLKGKANSPVVQVAYEDAATYAKWAGKRLPTEAEFEFAARGGLEGKSYAWGNDFQPAGKWMANTYQGKFPTTDTGRDGFAGLAPVGQFPPNRYGLYDMAGNVWQWCSDWYRADYYAELARSYPVAQNPPGPLFSYDPLEPNEKKRVQRGGSFLCNEYYCSSYLVGARGKGEINTGSSHLGFRCVKDAEPNIRPPAAKSDG